MAVRGSSKVLISPEPRGPAGQEYFVQCAIKYNILCYKSPCTYSSLICVVQAQEATKLASSLTLIHSEQVH